MIKPTITKTKDNNILNGRKLNAFPVGLGAKHECLLSLLLFNAVLKAVVTETGKGKEETNLFLFAGDMTVYVENPRETTKTPITNK